MASKKPISIRLKLINAIILVIIIQAALFLIAIFITKIFTRLEQNIVSITDQAVENKSAVLENEMGMNWSNLKNDVDNCNKIIYDELQNTAISFKDLNNNPNSIETILNNSVPELLSTIKTKNVSGAFIVLDTSATDNKTGKNPQSRSGVYLRNVSTESDKNNSDVMLEYGPTSIAAKHGIQIDANWSKEFNFAETEDANKASQDYFYKPYAVLEKTSNSVQKDFGYWSKPFKFSKLDKEVITYSTPLIDSNGNFYGIIGIELSTDYLMKYISTDELPLGGKDEYIISAETDNNLKPIQNPIINGTLLKKQPKTGKLDSYTFNSAYEIGENVYSVADAKGNSNIYAFVYPLKIYGDNSYYRSNQWTFVGLAQKSAMTSLSESVMDMLFKMLGVSTLIAILFALNIGGIITKPISRLAESVKGIDFSKPACLGRTGIKEVDELALTVENFSKDLFESSAKMSKVINMLDIPIATFEISKNSDKVLVTKSISSLLSLNPAIVINDYITKKEWDYIYNDFTDPTKLSYDDSYQIGTTENNKKWIKVKTFENEEKQIGVLIDVTDEVIKRKKLEYERDYDSLTGVMNRRAFYVLAEQIILEKSVTTGVIAMWDLDGLKYVNDHYGHSAGDKYIHEAARVLDSISNPTRAFSARLSGDEFITFIFGKDDITVYKDEIMALSEMLKNAYIILPGGEKIYISASAGISYYPSDAENCKELVKRADFAMYEVRNVAKNDVTEFCCKDRCITNVSGNDKN